MKQTKVISKAVIKRLPRYRRYLGELKKRGVEKISSKDLSELIGYTASQIRQDLNNFGGFGQQGYGYNVKYLYDEILDVKDSMDDYLEFVTGMFPIIKQRETCDLEFSFQSFFNYLKDLYGLKSDLPYEEIEYRFVRTFYEPKLNDHVIELLDYLKSLNMKAEINEFLPVYYERISQLSNKSNQFNFFAFYFGFVKNYIFHFFVLLSFMVYDISYLNIFL